MKDVLLPPKRKKRAEAVREVQAQPVLGPIMWPGPLSQDTRVH